MCWFGVTGVVCSAFVERDVVVGHVGFWVGFACPWHEVRDGVVDGFAADVTGSASASYMLAHP